MPIKDQFRRIGCHGLEKLESRECRAYVNVVNGVLQVVGDDWHNNATVDVKNNQITVHMTSTPASGFSLVPSKIDKAFAASSIKEIKFWGYKGDDSFICEISKPCTSVDGGEGNDYLETADAADVIYGGKGNDTIYGFGGDDKIYGGDGDDVLNGGAGKDRLEGGAGSDRAMLSEARETIVGCEAVRIEVPSGNAQSKNTCGPNSAWRVMQAHGGNVTTQKLIDSASRNSTIAKWNLGTSGKALVDAMNDNRRGLGSYSFSLKTNSSLDTIIGHLKEGKPVVAMVRVSGGESYGVGIAKIDIPKLHWIAVTGFDAAKKLVYYTDTNGGRYQQSYGSFNSDFNWSSDAVATSVLRGLGVVKGTFIV